MRKQPRHTGCLGRRRPPRRAALWTWLTAALVSDTRILWRAGHLLRPWDYLYRGESVLTFPHILDPVYALRLVRMVSRALSDPRRAVTSIRRRLASAISPHADTAPDPSFDRLDFNATYREHVAGLKATCSSREDALRRAIGVQFDAFGKMQRDLLVSLGLKPNHYLIDVGCGSGRLARPLAGYLTEGSYLGTDVVPELLAHAAAITARPDWRFEVVEGLSINEQDAQANFVCFFSVLTHLLHEESFVYLREAKRVLRLGGRIVFSFLEFHIYSHWDVFEENIRNVGSRHHLNQFMSRDGIASWAHHLGLEIEAIFDGDKPHIPLSEPVVLDDGTRVEGLGNLGQSVCVMLKP